MEVVTILAVGFVCIACFLIGAKVGQAVSKGKEITMPTVDTLKAYRERKEKTEAQIKQDQFDKVLRNLERYDGTADGQEDVG